MAGVIVIMLAIALFQAPGLLRQKQYRALLAFTVLWLLATIFSLMVLLDAPLPTLVDILDYIYGQVFYFFHLLKTS